MTTELTTGPPVVGVVVVVTVWAVGFAVVTATGAAVVVVVASGGGGGVDTVCGAGSLEHPAIKAEIARMLVVPKKDHREKSEEESFVVSMAETYAFTVLDGIGNLGFRIIVGFLKDGEGFIVCQPGAAQRGRLFAGREAWGFIPWQGRGGTDMLV